MGVDCYVTNRVGGEGVPALIRHGWCCRIIALHRTDIAFNLTNFDIAEIEFDAYSIEHLNMDQSCNTMLSSHKPRIDLAVTHGKTAIYSIALSTSTSQLNLSLFTATLSDRHPATAAETWVCKVSNDESIYVNTGARVVFKALLHVCSGALCTKIIADAVQSQIGSAYIV